MPPPLEPWRAVCRLPALVDEVAEVLRIEEVKMKDAVRNHFTPHRKKMLPWLVLAFLFWLGYLVVCWREGFMIVWSIWTVTGVIVFFIYWKRIRKR